MQLSEIKVLSFLLESNVEISNIYISPKRAKCLFESNELKQEIPKLLYNLGSAKSLISLVFWNVTFTGEAEKSLAFMIHNTQSLNSLKFIYCSFENSAGWIESLGKNNSLSKFSMYFSLIDASGKIKIGNILKENTNLDKLTLKNFHYVDNSSAISFSENLKINQSLLYLNLAGNNMQENELMLILHALEYNTKLITLILDRNNFTINIAKALGKLLLKNNTLSHISLYSCKIDNLIIRHISEDLKFNKSLKKLNLQANSINENGINFLKSALIQNCYLQDLNISQNELYKQGTYNLCDLLKENRGIRRLTIGENSMKPKGIRELINSIKIHRIIEYLSMGAITLNDEHAKLLIEYLNENNNIKEIYLSSYDIGIELREKIISICQSKSILLKFY